MTGAARHPLIERCTCGAWVYHRARFGKRCPHHKSPEGTLSAIKSLNPERT